MQVELTDEQVANLRWLLQAIGGDPAVLPIAILTVLDKAWAAKTLAALPASSTAPTMTLDDARELLGRFAADNATKEQLANVEAQRDAIGEAHSAATLALHALGIDAASSNMGDQVDAVAKTLRAAHDAGLGVKVPQAAPKAIATPKSSTITV